MTNKLGTQAARSMTGGSQWDQASQLWMWDYVSTNWTNAWLHTGGNWYAGVGNAIASNHLSPGQGFWFKTSTNDEIVKLLWP